MARKPKLFYLEYKPLEPLKEKIRQSGIRNPHNEVSIYHYSSEEDVSEHYAILSASDEMDKIIEEYGAGEYEIGGASAEKGKHLVKADSSDTYKNQLKQSGRTPLFGRKELVNSL